jgi:hypothetical protein
MHELLRCPSCYHKVSRSDFQCPRCELLLEGRLDDPPPLPRGEVSVVRALMERPQGSVSRKRPAPVEPITDKHERATMEFRIPPQLNSVVPRVIVNLTRSALDLTPFEAFVVWSCDGRSRADQLLPIIGLQEVELQVVLATLAERGAIALDAVVAPEPPRKAKPPLPPARTAPKLAAAPPQKPPPPTLQPAVARKPLAMPAPAPVTAPPKGETDQRVVVSDGVAKNRAVLDALKQVRPSSLGAKKVERAESSVSISDRAAEPALQVAIRMEQDGRIDEAVRYLERAITRSPDAASLLNRLAIILLRDRRDFLEAERLLRRALKLEPDHEVYRKNLVMVLGQAARENTGKHTRR